MAAENYALASYIFAEKTPEHPTKEDPDPKIKEEEKKECVIKKKVYDEPSTSNSTLSSCSIRNRSFQTMNADDYFSARTLSELYNNRTPHHARSQQSHSADEKSELTFPVKKESKLAQVLDNFFVVMDLNSFKIDFTSSENSLASKNHCQIDNLLLPNVFQLSGMSFSSPQKFAFSKISYDKFTLISIVKQLEKKITFSRNMKAFISDCKKIKNCHAFSAALTFLLVEVSDAKGPSVTTQGSNSLATKKIVANYSNMKNRIKNLDSDLQMEKQNTKSIQSGWNETKEDLKKAKVCIAELKTKLEKSEEERKMKNEMYDNLRKMVIEKDKELRKRVTLKKEGAEDCTTCKRLQQKIEKMDTDSTSLRNQIRMLTLSINDHKQKAEFSRNEIKALKKQVKELQEKLFEATVTPKMAAENYALASYIFAKKTPEHPTKEDPDPKIKEEEKKECVIKKKVYDEPSTSNSTWGSCSIRNRSFQTMSANDYFSARSLSELYNSHTQEDTDEESELSFPVKKHKVSETVAVSKRSAALKQLTERKEVTKKKTTVTSSSAQPLPDSATSMITEYPQRVKPLKISMKMQQLMKMSH